MKCIKQLAVGWIILMNITGSALSQSAQMIEFDYAFFAFDEMESLMEIYISFESLISVDPDTFIKNVVAMPINISLLSSSEMGQSGNKNQFENLGDQRPSIFIQDTVATHCDKMFVHKYSVTAPPGGYELNLNLFISDEDSVHYAKVIDIPDFNYHQRIVTSDIILADAILESYDGCDMIEKNGYSILPNVNQVFDKDSQILSYYAEVYAPDSTVSHDREYSIRVYVRDANGTTPIDGLEQRMNRQTYPANVITGSFDVSLISTGSYALIVSVLDLNLVEVAQNSRKFFVFNPLIQISESVLNEESNGIDLSIYAQMTQAQIDIELEQVLVIATHQESKRIKQLKDLDERRSFLKDLWEVRDPIPDTQINEFRVEFINRVSYANDSFSFQQIEGWKTDRGITLMKYGHPTTIESHLYERLTKPYQIWKYNTISGETDAEFVFADMNGFGHLELLHSTVLGEQKLYDWFQKITETN
ncbi:MAG: GWxTD domain-containing protein [Bacteroidetes bacterium]|nr:GWxTD domain-containing protein [Bacteroidota bacterium]